MRTPLVLLLAATVLAGCSEGPGHSIEGGHDHGAFHACPDGTVIDPGDYGHHHGDDFDPASKCPAPSEPARVTLRVEDDATAFQSVTLTWDITPSGDTARVVASQVRASRESMAPPAAPAEYGDVVAEAPDQDAPVEVVSEWVPMDEGTHYLRAHASIGGGVVWSDEVRVEVAQAAPTGVVHEVTIGTGTTQPGLDPADLELVVGDAVRWSNTDPALSYSVSSTDGPTDFDAGTAEPGATSDEVLFLDVGTWTYTVTDTLGRSATATLLATAP